MIDLQAIRTRAAARMAASQIPTPANVANRLIEALAISHLAGLAGVAACAAGTTTLDLAAVAWTDADIARFFDRRTRLLRWGWAEAEAEALAERLVRRDREADPRVMCSECSHYRPGRCGSHRQAGLQTPELGHDLAALLQRCPAFEGTSI